MTGLNTLIVSSYEKLKGSKERYQGMQLNTVTGNIKLSKIDFSYNKSDFLFRNLDQLAWQYCNKGFFNFKNYIPKIVSSFN